MIKLILVAVFAATIADAANVRHLQLDDAHLFDTTSNNYAIISQSLTQIGSKAVSINDQTITTVGQNCQATSRSLTSAESQQVQQEKKNFDAIGNGDLSSYSRWASWDFKPVNNMIFMGNNIQSQSFVDGNVRVTRSDDTNYSVSKNDWPNNMVHIFVTDDIAAIVYRDNKVLAKPVSCLTAEEKRALAPYAPTSSFDATGFGSDSESQDSTNNFGIPTTPSVPQFERQNDTSDQRLANLEAQVAQLASLISRLMSQQQSGPSNSFNNQQMPPVPPMPPHHPPHHHHHPHHPPPPPPPPQGSSGSPFGNEWPFGNNNNPFGPGFPWRK